MAGAQGRFVWYELMTSDMAAARAFYTAVFGWSAKDWGSPEAPYLLLGLGDMAVAGVMGLPAAARDAGAPPRWLGYVAVDDVAAAARRLADAGGTVHKPPTPISGVGLFAVATDPQGAMFVLFQPDAATAAPSRPAPGTPGTMGWHELHAADWQPAFDFYASQFGWTKDAAIDMGPMGTYQLFAIDGVQSGGMMTKAEAQARPAWLFYFNVEAIEAAVGRVGAAGGSVLGGPHPVPGGQWVAQCRDPQGALFALVGPAPS